MGNFSYSALNFQSSSDFTSTLTKISSTVHPIYGPITIHQLNRKPYNYYLEYAQILTTQYLSLHKYSFYQSLPEHKNLVKVDHINVIKKSQQFPIKSLLLSSQNICSPFDTLKVYCVYYNFTLEDAIKLKIKIKSKFTESQIIYILKALISVAKVYQDQFKQNGFYSGIFKSKSIFISPEGHLKVYPFNQNIFNAFLNQINQKEDEKNLKGYQANRASNTNFNQEINLQDRLSERTMKVAALTRNQSILSKPAAFTKIKEMKRSKLTTTIAKNKQPEPCTSTIIYPNKTNEYLQLKGINLNPTESSPKQPISLRPSQQNSFLSKRSSSSSVSILSFEDHNFQHNLHCKDWKKSKEKVNRKDMFEFGLMLMQLVLLNDQDYYYVYRQKRNQNNLNKDINEKMNNQQRVHDQIMDKIDRIPNFDLINFSLEQLIAKFKISTFLYKIIQKLLGKSNQEVNFQDIYHQIEKNQQINQKISYCLRFQTQLPDQKFNEDSFYRLISPLKKQQNHTQSKESQNLQKNSLSLPLGKKNSESMMLKPNFSKQLFDDTSIKDLNFSTKLESLMTQKNLSKSFIVDEDHHQNQSMLMNKLKNSRKLVPHKIRSISTKLT